jgi:DNA-binding transcriptional ArsR family regulator
MRSTKPERKVSQLLRTVGQPTRVQILLAIGEGEACVCHLEALLRQRQAYISQHLMALRKAKILTTRRDGRYIYYRLRDTRLLDLVKTAGELSGAPELLAEFEGLAQSSQACACPHCEPAPAAA